MKPDKTILKETGFLLVGTLILGAIMIGVFAAFRRLNYTVVTGALLGGLASVCNFFLMGLTIQKAVDKSPEDAKKRIQLSYTVRMFALLVVLGVGVYLPYFHWLAVLISALFPRVVILFRSVVVKKQDAENKGGEST